jgi:hypothetical protein
VGGGRGEAAEDDLPALTYLPPAYTPGRAQSLATSAAASASQTVSAAIATVGPLEFGPSDAIAQATTIEALMRSATTSTRWDVAR